MPIIYKTNEAAAEYAYYGLNLGTGCTLGCKYCYGPACMRKSKEDFHSSPHLKKDIFARVQADAKKLKKAGDKRLIHLCFIGDVCQTPETVFIASNVLTTLGQHGLNATILTKGGMKAEPLFPVLNEFGFSFGTSLVWVNDKLREQWEPNAASPANRYEAILKARSEYKLKTWVSLEPVIDVPEAFGVMGWLYHIVDHWKVGKISHNKELEDAVDWHQFYKDVTELLDSVGADYMIKESLKKYKVKQ